LAGGLSRDALPTIGPAENGVSIIAVKELGNPRRTNSSALICRSLSLCVTPEEGCGTLLHPPLTGLEMIGPKG